ncbi:MAG: undecaprenyldiphospho-muramoylpentapeptide beta-N-acetylglucosaminyltransferase [Deltaproteobacteria bacterium]|nr:undecaprenyldiphospho-muramoylpentapeptide beta-N-acetylglucosaminyltransferase [Deltaproteobacteria bacterium]
MHTPTDPEYRSDTKRLKVIVAGGGSGGHLFPGLAVAEEIKRRYPGSEILFVTGRKRIESDILTSSGFRQTSICVEGIKGRGWKTGIMVAARLPYSLAQSISVIRKLSPHLILGVGGYSAGPVCLAARMMGITTIIHEQNSFPGLTNRLLCRFADRIFISFEESRGHFPRGSIVLTGNPIRKEFLEKINSREKDDGKFTILVTGGSQGAIAINRAFVAALEILRQEGKAPQIIHHTGEADFDRVVRQYREKGLQGEIKPFIRDMPAAYRRADIFVGRAGAGTIFELAGLGKPSILIPYPHAANNHQEINARVLANAGGAEMMRQDDLTPEGLAEILTKYMENRATIQKMGGQAQKKGRPYAAKEIVDQLVAMIDKGKAGRRERMPNGAITINGYQTDHEKLR